MRFPRTRIAAAGPAGPARPAHRSRSCTCGRAPDRSHRAGDRAKTRRSEDPEGPGHLRGASHGSPHEGHGGRGERRGDRSVSPGGPGLATGLRSRGAAATIRLGGVQPLPGRVRRRAGPQPVAPPASERTVQADAHRSADEVRRSGAPSGGGRAARTVSRRDGPHPAEPRPAAGDLATAHHRSGQQGHRLIGHSHRPDRHQLRFGDVQIDAAMVDRVEQALSGYVYRGTTVRVERLPDDSSSGGGRYSSGAPRRQFGASGKRTGGRDRKSNRR
jgi:hypothetical protein